MCKKILTIDFESDNSKGHGLEFWHPEFKITSCAFLSGSETHFSTDFDEIKATLESLAADGYTFLVYNASFDSSVMRHVFGIKEAFSICIDVWRLFNYTLLEVSDKFAKTKRKTSLPSAVEHLYGVENYKRPFLDKIIEMGLADNDKKAHSHIAELPPELLEEYNILDVLWTYKVYEECIARLSKWGVDWEPDHAGYMNECKLFGDAFKRGIRVDRELLLGNIEKLKERIIAKEKEIRELPCIAEAESRLNGSVVVTAPTVRKWKVENGIAPEVSLSQERMEQVTAYAKAKKWRPFNFNSSTQKRLLFLDILKMPIIKPTAAGCPCMDKAVMKEYGDVGKMFSTYQNLSKQLDECIKIEYHSKLDGYMHCPLRSGSTVSGRSSSRAD